MSEPILQVFVRGVPEELWISVKIRCLEERITVGEFVTRALRRELAAASKKNGKT